MLRNAVLEPAYVSISRFRSVQFWGSFESATACFTPSPILLELVQSCDACQAGLCCCSTSAAAAKASRKASLCTKFALKPPTQIQHIDQLQHAQHVSANDQHVAEGMMWGPLAGTD